MTLVLNKDNFEKNIKEGLTLVDFWAEWCGPCQTMIPILDNLSEKMDGKMTISKVNVDENPEIAGQFGIMSIPTILVFKDGELVIEPLIGVQKQEDLEEIINELL